MKKINKQLLDSNALSRLSHIKGKKKLFFFVRNKFARYNQQDTYANFKYSRIDQTDIAYLR